MGENVRNATQRNATQRVIIIAKRNTPYSLGLQNIDFDDFESVYTSRLIVHPSLRICQGSFSTIR